MQSEPTETKSTERSVGSLVRELMLELTSMVRNEAELAKVEVSNKVGQLESGVFALMMSIVLLLVGLIGLMLAGIYGLAQVWPMWLAALAIGGGITFVGLIALLKGRSNLKSQNLALERSSREFRKEASFVRDQAR